MNALGALILLATIGIQLVAPRRWALLGTLAGVLFLNQAQQIVFFGLNLYSSRLMELAGFIRVMMRGEFSFSRIRLLDKIFVALYVYATVVFVLRSPEGQINAIGMAVDAILCYFTFRGLVQTVDDFRWFLRAFAILLVPYVAIVLIESFTDHNLFTMLEGGNFGIWSRKGRPRCLGSFRHPSLLGTLGAAFLPLYIGLAWSKLDRKRALLGAVLCMLIVWASNSGGPMSCMAVGIVGWLFWKMRTKMKWARRGAVALVVALGLTMKAPVWYLLARVSSVSGGDGWHRSRLLDMAFQNLDKWWLAGMPIRDTQRWFPYVLALTGGADLTNQFLAFGIASGLLALILFLVLLTVAFSNLGQTLAALRFACQETTETEYLLWGLGVMLGVHVFNWLGITYFDQTYVFWFMQLAVIASLTESLPRRIELEAVSADDYAEVECEVQ
jgi:hypothetical protein